MSRIGKRHWYRWTVIAIGIAAYYYVIQHFHTFSGWSELGLHVRNHPGLFSALVFLQLVLMVSNILTETFKWRSLLSEIYKQPVWQSLRQVLAGYSIGTLTPARLGEPAGRLIDLPKEIRVSAIGLTFVGGFIQNGIIIILGLIALLLNPEIISQPLLQPGAKAGLFVISLLIFVVVVLFLLKYLLPVKMREWIYMLRKHFQLITTKTWLQIVGLTLLRYAIFTIQLVLWLTFFNYYPHPASLLFVTPVYYLFVTAVPSFILSELGVRGSIALFVFGGTAQNAPGAVISVFLLWMLNVGIPTVSGASVHLKARK